MKISCATCLSPLTAAEAILLAEQALRTGRIEVAACYINVAYSLFDAKLWPDMAAGPQWQGS